MESNKADIKAQTDKVKQNNTEAQALKTLTDQLQFPSGEKVSTLARNPCVVSPEFCHD